MATDTKQTDPVCGMKVDPHTNLKAEYNDKEYCFCSKQCQQKFQNDPENYADEEE